MRARPESCLSDLALDRLLVGELALADRTLADRHLASCGACRARHAELVGFVRDVAPVLRRESRRVMPMRRHAVLAIAPVLAAAAAIVFLAVRHRDEPDGVRAKNGIAVDAIVRHADGRQELVLPGDAVGHGDVLRFRISSDGGVLALVAIDDSGAITPYREPAPVAAGRDVLLDEAIALDDSRGVERVIAVVCDAPIAMADIFTAARVALAAAGGHPRTLGSLGLSCKEATTWFVQR